MVRRRNVSNRERKYRQKRCVEIHYRGKNLGDISKTTKKWRTAKPAAATAARARGGNTRAPGRCAIARGVGKRDT